MTRKLLLAAIALFGIATLAGCDLYFGDPYGDGNDPYVYCDEFGCYECDDNSCRPLGGGGEPGWECTSNYDCAAGCYCDDGYCTEAGFCSRDSDCPSGFVCDDRASCVPEGTTGCTSDADCPYGTFCNEQSGYCVDSWTCNSDAECGMGYVCDDRGTCIPAPCDEDADCLEGCYCNEEIGECDESGICTNDAQCNDGFECDTDRNTCVPVDPNAPGSCNAEITCNDAAPTCPAGSTPGIKDGCYTGQCIVIEECDVPPPVKCEDITTELECFAADACFPTYTGINCTDPSGNSCTAEQSNCTCEKFVFNSCKDKQ